MEHSSTVGSGVHCRSLSALNVFAVTTVIPTAMSTIEMIRSQLPGLSATEQRIARFVLGNPADVIHLSVTDLSQMSNSSVGSVMRFCRSVGLRGYQDLKLKLARESIPIEKQLLDEVNSDDDSATVIRKVFAGTSRALDESFPSVDADILDRTVNLLVNARRILFVAVGTSAPLASDIAYRLTSIGLPSVFPADVHMQHVTANTLGPDDVCFAISHTGSTTETIAAMRTAAATGASTVALTSFARSPLTEFVDQLLVAGSRETSFRIESMSSRIVHLTVLDALFVLITLHHRPAQDALAATEDVLTEHRF